MRSVTRSSTSDRPRSLMPAVPSDPPRILSRADSEAMFKRVVALAASGGDTQVTIRSTWIANLRWARNRPTTSGDTVEQMAVITRFLNGASLTAQLDRLDDATLKEAMRLLEQRLAGATPDSDDPLPDPLGKQEYLTPTIWNDATYKMTPRDLSDSARKSVDPVAEAKLVAAGYVEIGAMSWAIFNTRGLDAYSAATGALYTETVRISDGTGSGWAGKSHVDWSKLDAPALSAAALQKCRDSANPFKIEPGRYTTVLEAKAAGLLMASAVREMNRKDAEEDTNNPYNLSKGKSKIGTRIFDSRITVTSDPTDPECGYIPFDSEGNPHHKVNWIENGVLKELPYNRRYARKKLGTDVALPNPQAFTVSGGDTSLEEMVKSTERGIYVTHFGELSPEDGKSLNMTGTTRDGLWLIEHGKIVHPIKNLWINDSPLIVFNQVQQLGRPVRTVGVYWEGFGGVERDLPTQVLNAGNTPVVSPPMKVTDFNFTRLIDAI